MPRKASPLDAVLQRHLAEPFPDSVEQDRHYGEVDPVMIGADICGWAARASSLSTVECDGLGDALRRLRRSVPEFPTAAQPYYRRLLDIAELALCGDPHADEELLELLHARDGSPTEVVLDDGRVLTVDNIAWAYDTGEIHAHVTANISPAAEHTTVHVFSTGEVAAVRDPDTGELLG